MELSETIGNVLNLIVVVLVLGIPVVVGVVMVRRGGSIARPVGFALTVAFIVLIVLVVFSYAVSEEAERIVTPGS